MSALSPEELKEAKSLQQHIDFDFKKKCNSAETLFVLQSIDWNVYINEELRTIKISYIDSDWNGVGIHMLSLIAARHGTAVAMSLAHQSYCGFEWFRVRPSKPGKWTIADKELAIILKDPTSRNHDTTNERNWKPGHWDPNPYVFSLSPGKPTEETELAAFKGLFQLLNKKVTK